MSCLGCTINKITNTNEKYAVDGGWVWKNSAFVKESAPEIRCKCSGCSGCSKEDIFFNVNYNNYHCSRCKCVRCVCPMRKKHLYYERNSLLVRKDCLCKVCTQIFD